MESDRPSSSPENPSNTAPEFRVLFDASPDAAFVLDLPAGTIREINRAACENLEQDRQSLLGSPSAQWVETRGIRLQDLLEQLSNDLNRTFTVPGDLIRSPRRRTPVELALRAVAIDGEPVAIVAGRDLAGRHAAGMAVPQTEPRLNGILQAAPTGIGLASDRVFLQVNDRLCQMTGYPREELIGQESRMLYPTEQDFNYVGREWYRQIREFGTGTVETRWRRKDGALIHVLLSSTPIDPENLSAGVTFTAFDISKWIRAESEREQLIGELEARNAELERFTYTVSHDLKSPLITIKGYIGMLAEDVRAGDASAVEEDIRRISNAADKMGSLLKELLELSRIGRIVNPPTGIRIDELAREAVEAVDGLIAARRVRVHIEPDMPCAYGDRQRLFEVLQNLIENAVKYMGDQQEPRISVGAVPSDGMVRVHVEDNGIGIAPEYHERVFGLFDQLDVTQEGSGIGLALARRIVEVHDGRIWVESEGAGTGARFCFTVPPLDR